MNTLGSIDKVEQHRLFPLKHTQYNYILCKTATSERVNEKHKMKKTRKKNGVKLQNFNFWSDLMIHLVDMFLM